MRFRLMISCAAAALSAPSAMALASVPDLPLIERTKLFGNPTSLDARLSPDGKWLAWIAPSDGVLNLWVAGSDDLANARVVTSEVGRPIEHYDWGPDSRTLLYINDKGGDENYRLYSVDVATGDQRSLTPFDKTRAQIVAISNQVHDRILIGLNNRDPRWHDVYSLNLATGALTLVLKNEGFSGFTADRSLQLRLAARARADGGTDYFQITGDRLAAAPFLSFGLDDSMTSRPLSFTADGRTLYWVDSRDRDKAALVAQDVASGRMTVIAQDSR
ncbi:MAG TPA: hypothetical protein VGE56_07460, partial [Rhodocyclaceae bacterium]